MLEIINLNTCPFYNLALEEYCLDHFLDQDLLILWQNTPTVVIGRNQNTIEEINLAYVQEKDVKVARRLSGGGAVYHDLGNLNFTFIINDDSGAKRFNFTRFTRPIIETLDRVGVKAEDNGRNDITIAGKKFSGNAQYRKKGRLLHHGTLLFASELEQMVQALNVEPEKVLSKGVKSVRSRVTNIADHLHEPMDIMDFRQILAGTIFSGQKHEKYSLDNREQEGVKRLKKAKYATWEFVYGSSPPANMIKKAHFDWGNVKVHFNINQGLIKDCAIYGDFFAANDITELTDRMRGIRYEVGALQTILQTIDITGYFPAANEKEILELFIK